MKKALSILALFLCALFQASADSPTFALVLSGGGARGVAHIAVLEELEKRGIYPDYIVGTSMGALIGAFYSAGYNTDQLEELITGGSMMDLFINIYTGSDNDGIRGGEGNYLSNMFSIDFSSFGAGASNGIIDDEYIADFLRSNLARVLSIRDFDDLSIPFRCIGTDLLTGEEIIFSNGSLYEAIRASMAMPVIFTPVVLGDGRYVIDGGVVNNLPVDVARALGADIVLAVDVNNSLDASKELDIEVLDTLTGVANQYLNLTTNINSGKQYADADYVIPMDTYDFNTMDFSDLAAIIELGRTYVDANQEVFDSLEKDLEKKQSEVPLNYYDRPEFMIVKIIYPGLEKYDKYFDYFEGKAATKELMQEFERTLRYLKLHERLKSVSFQMYPSGYIYVEVENYKKLSSSLSMGLDVSMGGRYHNSGSRRLSFFFMPHADIFTDLNFPGMEGTFRLGLDIEDKASLFAGYYYPFENFYNLYAETEIGVGSLSMLSIRDRHDRFETKDFGFNLRGGLAFSWKNILRLDFLLAMDLTSLGSISSVDGEQVVGITPVFAPKAVFTMNYEGLADSLPSDTGLDLFCRTAIHLQAPFMYSVSLDGRSIIYSPINSSRFFFNFEAASIREQGRLASSYRTTKSGSITRDYLFAEAGGRVIFSDDAYMDVGLYCEGFDNGAVHQGSNDILWNNRDITGRRLAPFATVNDFTAGFRIGFGYMTGIGTVGFELYADYEGSASLGFYFR